MAKTNQEKSMALINKGIATLSKSKINDEIGRLATMIILHAVDYDDISAADRLCEVVKNLGMRNDSLGKWFVETGCARIKEHKDPETGKITKRFGVDADKRHAIAEEIQKTDRATVAGKLRAKKWDEAKPKVSTYEGYNFEKRMQAEIKRAERMLKDHGSDPKTVVDQNLLARAKAIVLFANPEQAAPTLMKGVTTEVQGSVN